MSHPLPPAKVQAYADRNGIPPLPASTAAALARVAASVPPARPSFDRDFGHYTGHPMDPRNYDDGDDTADRVDDMSRTPQRVSDWMSDVACPMALPDSPVPFADLLNWPGAQTFEGLMTALIGGTQEQAIKAVYELRASFSRWAEERVNG